MALRTLPPGEDATHGARGIPVSFSQPGMPPGNDGVQRAVDAGQLENAATYDTMGDPTADRSDQHSQADFLPMVRVAEQQAQLYSAQANRKAWAQSLRAYHNEHFIGSKYTRPEWKNRSRLFVPKTRGAVQKDMAAVAASLFNNIDAITCLPGNEGDQRQRGAAAVMEELVNYRTTRTSGKAAFPWFMISMGARQDALLTGICASKQYWKHEYRKVREEPVHVQDETGNVVRRTRDVYTLDVDRPDMILFPPENVTIHSGADWTNPSQTAAFLILKYPLTVDEIVAKQNSPVNPWNKIPVSRLRQYVNVGKQDMEAIRRAREMGLDRFDETQTGTEYQVVWVYECFFRMDGDDWNFWTLGSDEYLVNPRPTREAYPAHFGERPVSIGYGSLEAHRIFPMAPAESWQPLQIETNDLRNLQLDGVKQTVMPVTKVLRGKRIDLDQIRRRSAGSAILVDSPEDVTFEQAPQMSQAPVLMSRELDLEFDDLAGLQNYGTVENNNAVGKTLGGLKLAAGAANSVQEYNIRVWIETWAEPALTHIVQLEQYYESDAKVLGICGQRAQLFEKYGINQIDDKLLEEQVTVRVSVGLGAGDPQQRLAKFESAAQIVAPLAQASPKFQSGQYELNIEAVWEEVFGAAGYKDGGTRFLIMNQGPRPNPTADLQTQKLQAEIAQRDRQGKGALFQGLAALAKVALGKKELEADTVDMLLGHQQDATERGYQHAHQRHQLLLSASDHGHRHGMAIADHRRNLVNDAHSRSQAEAEQQAGEGAGNGEGAAPASSPANGAPSPGAASEPTPAPSPHDAIAQLLQSGALQFTRGPDGRISGFQLPQQRPGGQ